MRVYVAPVQGHTDAAWRYFHHKTYGGDLQYFTPFMRYERGELRAKDFRDFKNPLNEDVNLEPQVIFKNIEELEILVSPLVKAGAEKINLNLGCPFPLQTARGRGAAFIRNNHEASKLPQFIQKYPEVEFSVKMRLGMENPDEWKGILDILNAMPLDNLYVHPRVARQNYSGELYLDRFAEIVERSNNPVVYNGDISTPDDMHRIADSFPKINGIMTARGILGRPSLANEFEGGEWPLKERLDKMMEFHDHLLDYYSARLCGESQILSKIKPFWEYAEGEIGRKAWKTIRKAFNLEKYRAALLTVC